MADAISSLIDHIDEHQDSVRDSWFYKFEPWDCDAPLTDDLVKLARADGVDFTDDTVLGVYGRWPKEFQTGIILNECALSITLAGSQTGKTVAEVVRNIMSTTGELPYAFRHAKGVDTGIPREITRENIGRFGRRDEVTGEIIDHDTSVTPDGTWNCGNIVGAGRFPESLIMPEGGKIWIGTTQRNYIETWLPMLDIHNNENCIIPPHMIDQSRGNYGYSVQNKQIFWKRGITWSFITYESGAVKFEGKKVFRIVLDEEPPNIEIFNAAQSHSHYRTVITTPYRGITWLKRVIDWKSSKGYKRIFHCTQFDSPYQDSVRVMEERGTYPDHEKAARVWGIPAVKNVGKPVFNAMKINLWMQRYVPVYQLGRFAATKEWGPIVHDINNRLPPLLITPVEIEESAAEDMQYVWRIYEPPEKGVAYVATFDPTSGAENPEEAGDSGGGLIARPANPEKKEKWPQPVAVTRTTLQPAEFARSAILAARHYNNATLCPEGARNHGSNAVFINEIKEWPWWYMHGTERWSTRKAQYNKGMDMNPTTRHALFKMIQDWEQSFSDEDCPNFYDDMLLSELAACIYKQKGSGQGRPDHPPGGKTDLTMCWGMMLYILTQHPDQFRCNAHYEEPEEQTFLDRIRGMRKQEPEWYEFQTFRK